MRRKNDQPVMRVGARVEALCDHAPFAASYPPQFTQGEQATVIGIRDTGSIELQFDDGRIPTMTTETFGRKCRIAFIRSEFRLIG